MNNKKKRAEQNKKSPDESEDDPAGGFRCGDSLNVAKIETFITFGQNKLFYQKQMIRPDIELCSQAWKQTQKEAAARDLCIRFAHRGGKTPGTPESPGTPAAEVNLVAACRLPSPGSSRAFPAFPVFSAFPVFFICET